MMTEPDSWDIVIAGAGLAGLSLAVELAEPEFSHLRVLLVEPRQVHLRDRTWSYWALPGALPKRWQQLPCTEWSSWGVSLGDQAAHSSGQLKYASLRADAFYDAALQRIAQTPHIQWLRQATIDQTHASEQGLKLTTHSGARLNCKLLFDSRPPASPETHDWVQHFKGWEIQTLKACFEPERVDLMAFEQSAQGLHFFYCLPYSSTRALVESTWISRANLCADAETELRNALKKRWQCEEFEIKFHEQGALPLMPLFSMEQPHTVRIGRAGGMLRASTGYAFCATLQQTHGLAASLAQHLKHDGALQAWRPPRYKNHPMDQWMDEVLFRVLERDWHLAPTYFLKLFKNAPELSLIRFLQGTASWQDRFAVMRALPAWPFMRAALS